MILHAVLVSPNAAAKTGWLWILFRSYYPVAFSYRFRHFQLDHASYGCVFYLWWGVVTAAAKL